MSTFESRGSKCVVEIPPTTRHPPTHITGQKSQIKIFHLVPVQLAVFYNDKYQSTQDQDHVNPGLRRFFFGSCLNTVCRQLLDKITVEMHFRSLTFNQLLLLVHSVPSGSILISPSFLYCRLLRKGEHSPGKGGREQGLCSISGICRFKIV